MTTSLDVRFPMPDVPSARGFALGATDSVTSLIMTCVLACLLIQLVLRVTRFLLRRRQLLRAMQCFQGPDMAFVQREIVKRDSWLDVTLTFEKYGPVTRLTASSLLTVLSLIHPAYIECVTRTAEPKPTLLNRMLYQWIGDGLLLSGGKKWARNRRLLTPIFNFDILKSYMRVFNEHAVAMTTKWQAMSPTSQGQSVEMFQGVSQMTLNSILECAFGCSDKSDVKSGQTTYLSTVRQLAELIAVRTWRPLLHDDLVYSLTYGGQRFRQACDRIHDFSSSVIKERRLYVNQRQNEEENETSKHQIFLDLMLLAKDEAGNGLTDTEIQHECDTFMFEGHDTTASAISWCLYNLACHPQYQDKCRAEIDQMMDATDNDDITWDDMSQLKYVTMCVKESLRTHPPVPTIMRQITSDITLPDGRHLPSGATVIISIYGCHHHTEIWNKPDVYNPERFGENAASRHPLSFIPFSAGPRNCIGQHFAMNEIKVCIAHVLRRFVLSPDEQRPAVKVPALTLCARDGVWLRLHSRQSPH